MKKSRKKTAARTASRTRSGPSASVPDELLPEYGAELIRTGMRGKYAAAYAESTNVVVLEPDVAAEFPNASAVNGALRELARIIRNHGHP